MRRMLAFRQLCECRHVLLYMLKRASVDRGYRKASEKATCPAERGRAHDVEEDEQHHAGQHCDASCQHQRLGSVERLRRQDALQCQNRRACSESANHAHIAVGCLMRVHFLGRLREQTATAPSSLSEIAQDRDGPLLGVSSSLQGLS